MDWYPRYIDLWKAKTMHLDPFQDGCYMRLVDHYMGTRQPLPDNDFALARIIGISLEQWLGNASGIVRAFFEARNGLLFQSRCDQILAEQDEKASKHSEKSKKGAEARWRKNKGLDATGIPQAMPTDATGEDRTGQSSTYVEDIEATRPHSKGNPDGKARRTARRATSYIPEDFRGDIGSITLAGEHGINAADEERRFIDYWLAKGEPKADWQACFRTWIRNAARYSKEREQRQSDGRPKTQGVVDAALRVAARYSG